MSSAGPWSDRGTPRAGGCRGRPGSPHLEGERQHQRGRSAVVDGSLEANRHRAASRLILVRGARADPRIEVRELLGPAPFPRGGLLLSDLQNLRSQLAIHNEPARSPNRARDVRHRNVQERLEAGIPSRLDRTDDLLLRRLPDLIIRQLRYFTGRSAAGASPAFPARERQERSKRPWSQSDSGRV